MHKAHPVSSGCCRNLCFSANRYFDRLGQAMQAPKRECDQPNERQPACQTPRLPNLTPTVLLFCGRGHRFAICLASDVDDQSLGGHFDEIA